MGTVLVTLNSRCVVTSLIFLYSYSGALLCSSLLSYLQSIQLSLCLLNGVTEPSGFLCKCISFWRCHINRILLDINLGSPLTHFSSLLIAVVTLMPLLCAIPTFSVSLLSFWVCSWGNHSSFKVSAIDHSGFPTFTINYFNSPATHSSEGFLRDPISVLGISNPHSFESVLCPPDLLTPACTHSFDTHYHWYVFVFTRLYSFILIHICSYLHRFNLHHMCLV